MSKWVLLLLFALRGYAVEFSDAQTALGHVQRVYIEKLGGGETSDQMRDMLIAALQNSGLFAITENPERADAVLRGSSDDSVYTDEHHTSDTLGVHTQGGASSTAKNSSRLYGGAGLTDNESSTIRERRHEAKASVRLVGVNGDVIWSTTQESSGGRFRGAMADVADKVVARLTDDLRRVRSTGASKP